MGEDLITDWFSYTSATQDDRSPEIYRKWSGISLVAGAMERKVWVKTGMNRTYCNLYVLLVGPSGTGKFIVETVRTFWNDTKDPFTQAKAFHVASDSLTKASLIDALGRARQVKLNERGESMEYHSMLVASEEFKVLLPAYDMEYIGTLERIWNSPPKHVEERRFNVKLVEIANPQLNILAGVQPSYFATVFPEEVWSTGLSRRIVMVYSAERKIRDPFTEYPDPDELRQRILTKLGRISVMWGELRWFPDAKKYYQEWVLAGEPPVPTHSRMIPYNTERARFVQKLCGISAVSRKIDLSGIERIDIERALEWLFEIESKMPEVFRAMQGKNDWAIVEELYHWIVGVHRRTGKPIPGAKIIEFISERITADKVERTLALAVRTRAIECVDQGADLWKPLAKQFRQSE